MPPSTESMPAVELIALVLFVFVAAGLATIVATALLNAVTFPRLRVPTDGPSARIGAISVLIPARDEAPSIGATLGDLLRQEPAPLEVVVLDDGSTDGTADVVRSAATAAERDGLPGAGRVRIVTGEPLPAGWAGKPWACEQLAGTARGEHLLFTDADTRWATGALSALAAAADRTDADLMTVWPTQTTVTWGERLTVPLIALAVLGYLPALLVHGLPQPVLAAANGQCLLFRRTAYDRVGGHRTVAAEVLDDVTLARRIKGAGLRLRMADGSGLIGCRMYDGWSSARDGFAKNILAGYGGRLAGLALATLFHWLLFLGPVLWLVTGWAIPPVSTRLAGTWPLVPAILVAAGIGARALTALATRQRVRDALLMPVSVVLMTLVAARAAAWARSGGPRWKGRVVPGRAAGGR